MPPTDRVAGAPPPTPSLKRRGRVFPAPIVELCEPARAFVADLAARCIAQPGAALVLDYGPERSTPGDSLQALANGRPADPLSPAGTADLTAHVDFQALAAIAAARRRHGASDPSRKVRSSLASACSSAPAASPAASRRAVPPP